jgi:hypothetical protein
VKAKHHHWISQFAADLPWAILDGSLREQTNAPLIGWSMS